MEGRWPHLGGEELLLAGLEALAHARYALQVGSVQLQLLLQARLAGLGARVGLLGRGLQLAHGRQCLRRKKEPSKRVSTRACAMNGEMASARLGQDERERYLLLDAQGRLQARIRGLALRGRRTAGVRVLRERVSAGCVGKMSARKQGAHRSASVVSCSWVSSTSVSFSLLVRSSRLLSSAAMAACPGPKHSAPGCVVSRRLWRQRTGRAGQQCCVRAAPAPTWPRRP